MSIILILLALCGMRTVWIFFCAHPVFITAMIYNETPHTVKSYFKALGLYNFKRAFGWAYKRGGGGGGLYPGGLINGIKKMLRNDELRRI